MRLRGRVPGNADNRQWRLPAPSCLLETLMNRKNVARAVTLALSATIVSCAFTFRPSPPSQQRVPCIALCNDQNDACCFGAADDESAEFCHEVYRKCEQECPK